MEIPKNIGATERALSAFGGAGLAIYGVKKRSPLGGLLAIIGAALLIRGATGKSILYKSLKINRAKKYVPPSASVAQGEGIKIERIIRIHRSPEELFRFWRNLGNLAHFMENVESVTVIGPLQTHWVVKGPAGTTVEWDAEIHNEIKNELIAWRTVGESEVDHAGSVEFIPDMGGTKLKVVISYAPPTGRAGAAVAKLFGKEPGQQLDQDLHRLKLLVEKGNILSNEASEVLRD